MDLWPFLWLVYQGWVQPVCLVVLLKDGEQKFQTKAFKQWGIGASSKSEPHLKITRRDCQHREGRIKLYFLDNCPGRNLRLLHLERTKVLSAHMAKPILMFSTAVAIKEHLRVNEVKSELFVGS